MGPPDDWARKKENAKEKKYINGRDGIRSTNRGGFQQETAGKEDAPTPTGKNHTLAISLYL